MPDRSRDQYLDLPEGDPLSTERIDERVHLASQQEQELKRKLEAIERQKRELEELGRRQDALSAGRAEMMEKLSRALVLVDKELEEGRARIALLDSLRENFSSHRDVLEAISPKEWEGVDINRELSIALGQVDAARMEYTKSFPKVAAAVDGVGDAPVSYGGEHAAGDVRDLLGWLKIGFAFSLPLILFGILALVVIISRLK